MNLSLKYTNHYYTPTKLRAGIGTERISSVTDTKSNLGHFIENLSYNDFFPVSTLRAMSNAQVEAAGEALEQTYDHFGLQYSVPTPVLEGSKPTPGYTDFNNASIGRYFFHPDHLGSSSYITDKAGVVSQHMEYLPFGELLVDEHLNSHNSPFKFNAKELDPETGNYYYGARYYDPKWSIWLSVVPLFEKYPTYSPYSFVGGNPIGNREVDGRYWVGTNGKAVKVRIKKDGTIKLGKNASADLRTMANRINKSGSETARSQFQRVANNKTKVNFKIVSEKVNNRLLGLHQAHDADGNPLSWEAGTDGTGKFDGNPSYITDDSGNMIYEEATITIFDGNIKESESQIQRYYGDPDLTAEEYSVSTFAHEGDHNTNQEAIDAIRERQEGGTNNFDIEKPAYKVTNDVLKEIKNNRD